MVPHYSVRPSTLVQRHARCTDTPIAASPLSGWLSDRVNGGVEWTSFFSLLLSVPWWVVMTIRGPISLFGSSLALSSESTSSKWDVVTQCRQCSFSRECFHRSQRTWLLQHAKYLGLVVRQHTPFNQERSLTGFRHADAHVFGAFNFAYSLSSAGGFPS